MKSPQPGPQEITRNLTESESGGTYAPRDTRRANVEVEKRYFENKVKNVVEQIRRFLPASGGEGASKP